MSAEDATTTGAEATESDGPETSRCQKICNGILDLLNPVSWYKRMKTWTPKQWLKFCFIIFLLAFFILAIVFGNITSAVFTAFLKWMERNLFIGSLAYVLIYTITTVLLIPGSLLTLGAGFVFNEVLGTWGVFLAALVVMLGASSGATASFILAKTLLRESVEGLKDKYPSFATIDAVVEIYGLKVTFLLRLSPAIPFNVFNYLMGLTSVRLIDYVLALSGMLPGTLAYCFVGASLGALADASSAGSDPLVLIFFIVGTAITIVGMIVLSIYAKKKYAELKEKVVGTAKKDDMAETPRQMKEKIDFEDPPNNNQTSADSTGAAQAEPQPEPETQPEV